jgi:hypothetical protein
MSTQRDYIVDNIVVMKAIQVPVSSHIPPASSGEFGNIIATTNNPVNSLVFFNGTAWSSVLTSLSGNFVSSFNGLTGAVTGVSSFNGANGAVTGVSTFNGASGAVVGVSGFHSDANPARTGVISILSGNEIGINDNGNGSYTISVMAFGINGSSLALGSAAGGLGGNFNTSLGVNSLPAVGAGGTRLVGVGENSGAGLGAAGSDCIFIGASAGTTISTVINAIAIGSFATVSNSGEYALGSISNPLNTNTNQPRTGGTATALPAAPVIWRQVRYNGTLYYSPLYI